MWPSAGDSAAGGEPERGAAGCLRAGGRLLQAPIDAPAGLLHHIKPGLHILRWSVTNSEALILIRRPVCLSSRRFLTTATVWRYLMPYIKYMPLEDAALGALEATDVLCPYILVPFADVCHIIILKPVDNVALRCCTACPICYHTLNDFYTAASHIMIENAKTAEKIVTRWTAGKIVRVLWVKF